MLGRISFALSPVAIVLMVSTTKNSFGTAGLASGSFTLAGALCVPWIGRLADRLGARRVLPIVIVINLCALLLLVASSHRSAAQIASWSTLAGATFPNFGSYTRTRWGRAISEPTLLTSALSIESVLDEFGFVVGPALAGLLFALVSPQAPIEVGAVLMFVGGCGISATTLPHSAEEKQRRERGRLHRIKHFQPLLLSLVALGTVFGGSTVSIVAAAKAGHEVGAGGILVSLYACGSVIAGTWYGTHKWKTPLGVRYAATLAMMSLSTCVLWILRSTDFLWITVVISGCAISPTLIAANSFMREIVPPKRLTEAFSFIGAAISIGITLGSVISGWLVNHFGAWNSFYSLTIASAIAAVIAWFGVAPNREHF